MSETATTYRRQVLDLGFTDLAQKIGVSLDKAKTTLRPLNGEFPIVTLTCPDHETDLMRQFSRAAMKGYLQDKIGKISVSAMNYQRDTTSVPLWELHSGNFKKGVNHEALCVDGERYWPQRKTLPTRFHPKFEGGRLVFSEYTPDEMQDGSDIVITIEGYTADSSIIDLKMQHEALVHLRNVFDQTAETTPSPISSYIAIDLILDNLQIQTPFPVTEFEPLRLGQIIENPMCYTLEVRIQNPKILEAGILGKSLQDHSFVPVLAV